LNSLDGARPLGPVEPMADDGGHGQEILFVAREHAAQKLGLRLPVQQGHGHRTLAGLDEWGIGRGNESMNKILK
jgi:hypothetical protein